MTIKELQEERKVLVRKQRKEYERLGNTQECQRLWNGIVKIDDEIEKMKGGKR